MRRLLYVIGLFALCIGCSTSGGTGTVNARPTPTPSPQSFPSTVTLCENAPTLTLPGTYAVFSAGGIISGSTFTLDSGGGEVYAYLPVTAASAEPSSAPTPIPTPNPSASPYDVWSGTVTYTGTPHDATECFLLSALVSRGSYGFTDPADNSQVYSVPQFGTQTTNWFYAGHNDDTVENFVLTLSTTSPTSGSFTLAGGGLGAINITQHAVYTASEARRAVDTAIAAHKIPGLLR